MLHFPGFGEPPTVRNLEGCDLLMHVVCARRTARVLLCFFFFWFQSEERQSYPDSNHTGTIEYPNHAEIK